MKEYVIDGNDAGIRLTKFCGRVLKEAPTSFLYKMLRKKNITLNGKKAKGDEILCENDRIRFYLSDETFASFQRKDDLSAVTDNAFSYPDIVYEDEHILIVNKPAGVLSQKATAEDISMNEICLRYLVAKNCYDPDDPSAFRPSVCNRLDRNTSGLLMIGKTAAGARLLSDAIKNRTIRKFYAAIAYGSIDEPVILNGYLKKDAKTNTVSIVSKKEENADPVQTVLDPIAFTGELTLLRVELITGKPHQIRAHLRSIGHPILGDPKYGDPAINMKYSCSRQMLHAYRLEMPDLGAPLSGLSGKVFEIPFPEEFDRYMRG